MDETKKEPTTAEAFANTRAGLERLAYLTNDSGPLADLTLLKRRLGAVARALTTALRVAEIGDTMSAGQIQALRLALTDAPPVFTLEEVEGAMAADGHNAEDIANVVRCLATLRR